jgi:RNA polymerase sigma factor (sigma-70 family)
MKLTAVTKIKNGALWEALKAFGGTQKAFAEFLGVDPQSLNTWLGLRAIPNLKRSRKRDPEKWQSIEDKLITLAGVFLEDIFPQELIGSEFLKHTKTIEIAREVETIRLIDAPREFLQIEATQESDLIHSELAERLDTALKSLTPRQEKILKMRFGLDDKESTLQECGENFAITRERARLIEMKALSKLRMPSRNRPLRPFLD